MKKSKKLLSFLLCAVMVLGCVGIGGEGIKEALDIFSVKASADYLGKDGLNFITNNNEAVLIDITSSVTGNVVIPDTVNGYPVTGIGDRAFAGRSDITSITFPDTLISIGEYAFNTCTGLTSITLPNTVTSIGNGAFAYCGNLTSVNIPSGVKIINQYTFMWCSSLTGITIPNGVTSIGMSAFEFCKSLPGINIPDSVTSIENYAFTDVINITYSENMTASGSPWSAKCANGYIDGYLVYADSTKTEIKACATSASGVITIPNGVTSIGARAFSDCMYLTNVIIPDSVTSIGEDAFYDVLNVSYSENMTAEGSPWCARCANGYIDGNLVYTDASKTELVGCSYTATGEITLPDSVTIIDENAFKSCSYLTGITIPDSVTEMGAGAFSYCASLQNVVIGNGVTRIGEGAFYYCTGIRDIIFPESLKFIGYYAFSGCSSLKEVHIPSGVTFIGDNAFESTDLNTICSDSSDCAAHEYANKNWFEFKVCSGHPSVEEVLAELNSLLNEAKTDEAKEIINDAIEELANASEFEAASILEDAKRNAEYADYMIGMVIYHATVTLEEAKENYNSDEAKAAIDAAISEIENSTSSDRIDEIRKAVIKDAEAADTALADAKADAKAELEEAKNNAASDEAKAALNEAIESIDNATNLNAVASAKTTGITKAENADKQAMLDIAEIKVADAQTVDYRSIVTITATAENVPEGYILAIYVDGKKVAGDNNKSVTYSAGELKSDINYTVKVIDANGNVQKTSEGKELSAEGGKITCNKNFFIIIIAFFKGLFGKLPKAEIIPRIN